MRRQRWGIIEVRGLVRQTQAWGGLWKLSTLLYNEAANPMRRGAILAPTREKNMFLAPMICLACCMPQALPESEIDYAHGAQREAWLRHPVYGDPSFDAFDRLPGNPAITGAPPLEWPVNGFLFEDPASGAWYLYAGRYAEGYALGPGKRMICTVARSTDGGANWEELGPIFQDDAFRFEGDSSPSNYAPDVSVVYYDGRYHLVYDWLNDRGAWEHLANPPDRDNDSGMAYAWSDRPEGPFTRAAKPIKRTSEQPLLHGRYRRLYASTLIRREQDWLILTLTDSGPYFAWALLGMTAPDPEGPWTDLVPLLHVDQPRYLPPLLEYFPAFLHDGCLYAPATSVAANRNYQALFRVRPEEAMDPAAWENVAWGGLWHAEPRPEEYAGIWGQTFSGFVDKQGCFTVMFPSRNADNRGTLNLAQRPWDRPYREQGFVLAGAAGPSLGLLKNAYDAFALHVAFDYSGTVSLIWNHRGALGPDRPRSDAKLHPLSLADCQGLTLAGPRWELFSRDASGGATVHASGTLPSVLAGSVDVRREASGQATILADGVEIGSAMLSSGAGGVGLLLDERSRASVLSFQVTGAPLPLVRRYLHTEALLGAGQNMAFWREASDPQFCLGLGAVSQPTPAESAGPPIAGKWNVECASFRLWAPLHPEYGQGELYLDDVLLATLDFSAPQPEASGIRYDSGPLPPGRRAVTLRAVSGALPLDCLEVELPSSSSCAASGALDGRRE